MTSPLDLIKERLKRAALRPRPIDEYANDGDICAECNASVSVKDGCEWEDGMLCDTCWAELGPELAEDLARLIRAVECLTTRMALVRCTGGVTVQSTRFTGWSHQEIADEALAEADAILEGSAE